jgi:hypothetical protein
VGLPPLDVAAFVGFAERGPLDTPVAVTDVNTYRAIFGGDLAVAREASGGSMYAALPTAVANFFGNGGRRCYVVRVAGKKASATRFHLPALVAFTVSRDPADLTTPSRPRLVSIRASSAGRWSQQLRIGARLQATPLPPAAFSISPDGQLSWLTGSAPEAIQTGDMLRLTFNDERQWLFPVTGIQRPADATPATPVRLMAAHSWQLAEAQESSPPRSVRTVRRLTWSEPEQLDVNGTLSIGDGEAAFALSGADANKINPGDALQLEMSDDSQYIFGVTTQSTISAGSPPSPHVVARATGVIRMPAERLLLPASPSLRRVERLRFDLRLSQGKERRPTLSDLSFNAGPKRYPDEDLQRRAKLSETLVDAQPTRFWGEVSLLESSVLYRRSAADVNGRQVAESTRLYRLLQTDERIDAARDGSLDPAALAGLLAPADDHDSIYLPLGMQSILSEDDLVGPSRGDIGDDDLKAFDPSMFVDPFLVPQLNNQPGSGGALMNEAVDRFYLQNKRLRGMHSLMFIDEVALLSTPESTHRGWRLQAPESSPPVTSPPVTSPSITSPPQLPDNSQFHYCDPAIVPEPPVTAAPVATEPQLATLLPTEVYSIAPLLEIQHAMLNFCQARGDVVCILTLPLHFEKRHCIDWQERFRQQLGLPARRSVFSSASREISDLSYAAVFHPWLLQRDANSPDGLRRVSCDGAVCGMIAARERARQVWVAPANVPLQGVLGLTPAFDAGEWADLFDLQFNLARAEPRDFRLMSAHTLSDEAILQQISVRRLMILLRKAVSDRGMDFVFESNHQRFRETVRMMLEELLRFMFERGAFAGATTDQAYRVVTDKSVNTPESVDAGRFIAQIQVAPSQPLEFITVLLTRIGENLLQAREA